MIDFKNNKFVVFGLGISGYCSSLLLHKHGAKVKVTEMGTSDIVLSRAKELRKLGIECELGSHTKEFCSGVDVAVLSPGIDPKKIDKNKILNQGTQIIGELELGYRFCKGKIVAVTGTNGKSTTTELIGHIFSSSGYKTVVCGNIGNPLSGEIEKIDEETIVVLEVSSFQLETIKKFAPHVAILLNVSDDHFDRHGDFRSYKNEKFNIFKNQTEEDWAILHSHFHRDVFLTNIKSRCVFYGAKDSVAPVTENGIGVLLDDKSRIFIRPEEITLRGKHNFENIACAILVASIMGAKIDDIRSAIAGFSGLSHRFETIGEFSGIKYIDDSKATNINATKRALESIDQKVILIAGGRDKGGDYSSLLSLVKEKVKKIVVIGEAKDKIKKAFASNITIVESEKMEDAIKDASENASSGDIVILSPMCSSFDMYSNYKERGEIFKKEVEKYFSNKNV